MKRMGIGNEYDESLQTTNRAHNSGDVQYI